MNSDHNQRPRECSTEYLESIENSRREGIDDFIKELNRRRGMKRDLKALRASRREARMDYIKDKTAKQAATSGDPRKK